LRILSGRSPFSADRNHIHHLLLDLGFSHTKATITIVFISSIFVAIGYSLQTFGNLTILIVIFVIAIFLSLIAKRLLINKKMKLAE
jgi:UDP-N-acetylmuramyl pentapeptide phosphotransferase/UDP-N-acetylglucosamine-1-phosphate transferase